ncbi:MAG: glycoside hydrolase family 5 protein [Bacteroidales bacterium]|nr:glycoside hydrolase family 5 protein [Bacteroidales bacterium]
MKKWILMAATAALALFPACQPEKKQQNTSDELKVSVKIAAIGGRSPSWAAGDIVYFSDDASTRPGFQFKAAAGDISADGKTLQATYKSGDPAAKTLYAIHAPTGRIRMKKTETITVAYDGTLGGAAMPAGTAAKGTSVLTLSPIVGVGEFTLKRGYVETVRISSNRAIFPKTLTYDFGRAGLNILKTTDLIEVATSGNGPFYVPLVPGEATVSFNLDFMDGEGQVVASGTYEGTLSAVTGKLTSLGNLDENAVDILDPSVEEFEKAAQAIKNMGVGLNNGTFEVLWKEYANKVNRNDPSSYEKYGGGITTQATMNAYAAAGFKSVRIPVTWWPHMDDIYSTIDKVWLDRIEEVVNYCKNANLYCIINMHHDAHAHKDQGGQWLFADIKNYDQITKGFQNIWKQIAERFKDYDEWLLFEGYNEITDANDTWTFPKNAEDITAANKLNQDFVNTVRKTGGKNATRNLIVSTYTCTVNEKPIKAFEMPSDLRPGHLIVQVHNYAPTSFCSFSSATKETFGDPQDYTDIQTALSTIKRLIVDKGWPCVLGEYGAPWEHQAKTQQPDGTWRIKIPEEERAKHGYYYTLEALKLGIAPMFWYTPTDGTKRQRGEWTYPKVKDALIQAWNEYNNGN